jgi:hypothetical protein
MAVVGVYPGSFNPPTTAHLAIAASVRQAFNLDRLVLSVSQAALAKEAVTHPRFDHRIEILERSATHHPWLSIQVTHHQLLADIAEGFDLLVVGADKWWQIQDLQWYDHDPAARDRAMARLPEVAVIPRDGLATPAERTLTLEPSLIEGISSTRARSGQLGLMTEAARDFALETGAWIDTERYDRWAAGQAEVSPD